MVMTSHRERKCIRRVLFYCVFVAVTVSNEDKMPSRCISFGVRTQKWYVALYTLRDIMKTRSESNRPTTGRLCRTQTRLLRANKHIMPVLETF